MSQFEQWENVKFCQKLGKSASETFHMIKQTYGEALGCSAVFKWHKGFACPRGAAKTAGHRFATPSMLTWSRTMRFLFLSPLVRKATWASISDGRRDRCCHKGSCMGTSCKYLSAVFPAAIPTLEDLHRGQRWLFWGWMWMCVSVCEYLLIWCYKTTVHEIIDCSSRSQVSGIWHHVVW
jgi:hypothetical protein